MQAARSIEDFAWKPHPGQQYKFSSSVEFEVLYGGAAGGGKTDCLIMEATRDVWHYGYNGLILRRTFPQLQEIIERTREYYPLLGGEYRASEHRWYFPSGATIDLGHVSDSGSHYNYQGKEFQFIGFDEAGQFIPAQYLYLFSRCRSIYPEIRPRIRSATNPGGIGHIFLKNRFQIGNTEPETTIVDLDTGLTRKYIPAKIQDNPTLMENDPAYIKRLMLLPEIERMRLLEGVWDAFEGQVFTELNREVHGVEPFDLPPEWEYFRTFDWGYSKPWCCIFWANDFDGKLYIVKVIYGAKVGENGVCVDVGLKQSDAEIAREIKKAEQELGVKVRPGPACKSTWAKRPAKGGVAGPAPFEEMQREGVVWLKADHDRISGKRQFHTRLRLDEEGNPHMYVFNDAGAFWDFIPLLRESDKNPEDVQEDQEHDHIYEAVRFGLMYKPIRPQQPVKEDVGSFQWERRKMIRAKALARKKGISLGSAYGRVRG